MESLNLADLFVTFLALFGPQKVLLSFGRLARTLDDRSVRVLAATTAAAATASVAAALSLALTWLSLARGRLSVRRTRTGRRSGIANLGCGSGIAYAGAR